MCSYFIYKRIIPKVSVDETYVYDIKNMTGDISEKKYNNL